jgi:hypothetical protein
LAAINRPAVGILRRSFLRRELQRRFGGIDLRLRRLGRGILRWWRRIAGGVPAWVQ